MMNSFLAFILRSLIAAPTAVSVWLVAFFAFDQTFPLSGVIGVSAGIITFWLSGAVMKSRFLKRHDLSRKEYAYIEKNLDEAKGKLARLHKALMSIRHMPSLKERVQFIRVTRKIYRLTKKEPKRFYLAERFYFSHLDSAVELAEKYVFLSSQPKMTMELEHSLRDTRKTLQELTAFVEKDLYDVIAEDIDQLHFEIDVAKHSIKTLQESRKNADESRRIK
ncbi:MAG: 5-bromo-4-chloroindolyl phosphate hydrolysis family protein [Cytobacillus gottheilii]